MPRHDQRDPASPKHGKRKISYPLASKAHPLITETGTAAKTAKDKSGDFGQAHPDYATALRISQETDAGDDTDKNYAEVFETLPGFPLTSTRIDADGATVTVTQQRMAVGDIVTSSSVADGIWTRKFKGDGNAVAATQIIEQRAAVGNAVTSSVPDEASDSFFTITRTLKPLASITPAFFRDGSNEFVTITSKDPIDNVMGYEVVTSIPKGPHYDSATAKISLRNGPKQFPTYINIEILDEWGTIFGKRQTFAEQAQFTEREWWVIAETEPPLALDIITPGDIFINEVQYNSVLHDETTRFYGEFVTIPATVPSATEYGGERDVDDPAAPGTGTKWIGTEKIVGGSVVADGHPNRFHVRTTSTIMQ